MAYLKIAPYFIIAALLIGLLWYRGEAIDAEASEAATAAELALAKQANDRQAAALEQLVKRKARDDQLLADIANKLAGINQDLATTSEKITGLEKTNETVRAYLAHNIPAELRGLLNRP